MFIAGSNMAGYMPDSEPQEYDDFDAAKQSVIDELLDDADAACSYVQAADLTYAAEDANLESSEFGYTLYSRHYFVTSL